MQAQTLWRRSVLHNLLIKAWTQVLRRFKFCSRFVGDSRWWGSLTMVPAGKKAKFLSSVKHTTKTIHYHHHHHQQQQQQQHPKVILPWTGLQKMKWLLTQTNSRPLFLVKSNPILETFRWRLILKLSSQFHQ